MYGNGSPGKVSSLEAAKQPSAAKRASIYGSAWLIYQMLMPSPGSRRLASQPRQSASMR